MSTFTSRLIISSQSMPSSSPARPSPLLGSLLCISLHLHAREMASRYAKRDQLTERSAKPSNQKKSRAEPGRLLSVRCLHWYCSVGMGGGRRTGGGAVLYCTKKGNLPFPLHWWIRALQDVLMKLHAKLFIGTTGVICSNSNQHPTPASTDSETSQPIGAFPNQCWV